MASISLFGTILLALASAGDAGLRAAWLYNAVDRPVPVVVASEVASGAAPAATLVLMDADGELLARAADVAAGEVDLARVMPEIWRLRRAAYLQLLVEGEPVGSALVVQPLLSRLVPVTEDAINPSGIEYTRIVDWYDEFRAELDEREREQETPARSSPGVTTGSVPRPAPPRPPATTRARPDRVWLAPPNADDRLLSGVRLYPERDVLMRTSLGDVRLAMRPDEAPNTAWNFLRLAEGGFYRGIVFHRVVPMTPAGDPFVIQAGDPTPTGSGGPGYWLPIERSGLAHTFGVISMARDVDPDSAGSQIFICLSRAGTARLDGHYCSFGEAVSGTETILAIGAVELADPAKGRPVTPPVIESMALLPAPPRRPGAGRPDAPVTRPVPTIEAPPERVPR